MDYKPAPHVLDNLKTIRFVAVVGPTAAGKSTVIETAVERDAGIHLLLNNTSRAPRPGEREGVDYRFLSREAMEARIAKGEYAQVAPSLFGDYYATAPEDYHPAGMTALPVLAAAVPMFRTLPFKQMRTIFIVPPSYATWQARIDAHGFTAAALQGRMKEAVASLEFALHDHRTQLIINKDIEQAATDFITLATGQELSPRLQQDQIRGREIAADLLKKLRTLS